MSDTYLSNMLLSIRNQIRNNVAAFINTRHNTEDGTVSQTFRRAFTTPWKPGEDMRPSFCVEDNGTRRAGDDDSETLKTYETTLVITLNLKDDYRRTANYEATVAMVEDIILHLQNRTTIGAGVYRVDYQDDDPFKVVLPAGASEHIWIISFNISWAASVPVLES